MKLKRLELENFRQFRDETLEFARGPEKGVTVIHGSNGAGKTTLLNAFTWLFYGEVDFDTRPDRLVTEGTIAEASVGAKIPVTVNLRFEHEGVSYRAERQAYYTKRSSTDFDGDPGDGAECTVKIKENDSWSERNNPENTLDQIMPERLSGLFFFDGEDIEELAGIDNQSRIQESIENIMGLTILERATRHLNAVAGRFESEAEEHGSDELKELIQEKKQLENTVEDLERQNADTERSIEQVEQEIQDIEQQYDRLDDAAALQTNRENYETERAELQDEIEEINQQIRGEINNTGFISLATPLIKETAEELDQMRQDGEIPSDLTDSFIDSLLNSGQCICGRPLKPGTKHRKQIQNLRGDAVADGVETSAIQIMGDFEQVEETVSEFFDNIDSLIDRRKRLHDKIESKTELIDKVSSELEEMDIATESGESPAKLEQKRNNKLEEKEDLEHELGRIEERITQTEEEIEEIEEEIDELEEEQEEARVAQRRQHVAELIEEELETAYGDLKDKVRKLANQKIKGTFGSIASKDLTAEVTEDFELKIWQDVGAEQVEVDKSTGERQIASLAFVGSLVDIARERYESNPDSDYFTGGIYPLVMDSPFGALDKSHRREVGRVIPTLANQVIVLATDSQWEGPVEEEMTPMVGEQYWLDFDMGEGENSYPQTRIKSERAAIGGD